MGRPTHHKKGAILARIAHLPLKKSDPRSQLQGHWIMKIRDIQLTEQGPNGLTERSALGGLYLLSRTSWHFPSICGQNSRFRVFSSAIIWAG